MSNPWISAPPARPGKYLWRKAEGQREFHVQVQFEFSIRGEVSGVWLCYELTDFTDMRAGGDWKFVAEYPVGRLPLACVERMARESAWSTIAPTDEGWYLWREAEARQPYLITLYEAVAQSTNQRERFIDSWGHATAQEFEALTRKGQWARVQDNNIGY